ncbi:Hypothetical predicted protein [Scomber scombrus]|uniref:Uncharacterized protein n=1 Tax=Scomber scombrus TaxID=13677 RepID=A0AAV1PS56_SCOSC
MTMTKRIHSENEDESEQRTATIERFNAVSNKEMNVEKHNFSSSLQTRPMRVQIGHCCTDESNYMDPNDMRVSDTLNLLDFTLREETLGEVDTEEMYPAAKCHHTSSHQLKTKYRSVRCSRGKHTKTGHVTKRKPAISDQSEHTLLQYGSESVSSLSETCRPGKQNLQSNRFTAKMRKPQPTLIRPQRQKIWLPK